MMTTTTGDPTNTTQLFSPTKSIKKPTTSTTTSALQCPSSLFYIFFLFVPLHPSVSFFYTFTINTNTHIYTYTHTATAHGRFYELQIKKKR